MAPFASPTAGVLGAGGDRRRPGLGRRPVRRRRAARASGPASTASSCTPATATCCTRSSRPHSNQRDDRWGGSVEARAELLVEVVRAVRAAVGPDFPLWARDRRVRGAPRPGPAARRRARRHGRSAVDAGLDAIHVTAYGEPMVATGITDGHTPARARRAARRTPPRVRRELGVPVIAMGRLTPEAAEQALADGAADVIAMGRAADRRPRPARTSSPPAGATGSGPCAYQYRCIGAIFLNEPVRCAVNPDAGHEADAVAPRRRRAAPRRRGRRRAGRPRVRPPARRARPPRRAVGGERPRSAGGCALAEQADPDLVGLRDWLVGAADDAGVVHPHCARRSPRPSTPTSSCGPPARPDRGRPSASTTCAAGSTARRLAGSRSWSAAAARRPCRIALRPERDGARRHARARRPRARPRARAARPLPPGGRRPAGRASRSSTRRRTGRHRRARRPAPPVPPAAGASEVHVIGDAAGTAGLAAALAAAAADASASRSDLAESRWPAERRWLRSASLGAGARRGGSRRGGRRRGRPTA